MGIVPGFVVVAAAMLALFLVPRELFVAATFGATTAMLVAAYLAGGPRLPRPALRPVLIGLASAAVLYFIFYGGNLAVANLGFLGIGGSSVASIYSLIASPSNPIVLRICVLVFDAAGYEWFFRGTLQAKLQPKVGIGAAPITALIDAGLHLATFNPLWVATTFVADLSWGLTYYYGRDISASFASHLVWDLAIFIISPIR
jgi:membrane protease YdiL (CAAX protease family)